MSVVHSSLPDALFIDCDGVVTDKRANVNPEVLRQIALLSGTGIRIAFVSGRSVSWQKDAIFPLLKVSPGFVPENFVFVGEHGADWALVKRGEFKISFDEAIVVPPRARQAAAALAKRLPLLWHDHTKRAMLAFELRHELMTSPEKEREARQQLAEVEKFYESLQMPDFRVYHSTYACDFIHASVGKAPAALRALELERGSERFQHICVGKGPAACRALDDLNSAIGHEENPVRSAVVFGDSPVDLEMADALHDAGLEISFVYTGENVCPAREYPIICTEKKYDAGTKIELEKLLVSS